MSWSDGTKYVREGEKVYIPECVCEREKGRGICGCVHARPCVCEKEVCVSVCEKERERVGQH